MKIILTLISFTIALNGSIVKKHQNSFRENAFLESSKNITQIDSSWHKDATLQGVSFYYKKVSCVNEDTVLLAIENNNNTPVVLLWSDEVWIDDQVFTTNSFKTYTLNVDENKEGSCGNNNLKIFEIKLRELSSSGSHITGFHFKNIKIIL